MPVSQPWVMARGAANRMDRVYRPEFLAVDAGRQARGAVLEAWGFGPLQRPFQVRAMGPRWRLRDYGGGLRASLLVIGAPIKRPYVWDLAPSVSAIGCCLDQGFRVHLFEWTPPQLGGPATGLDDYVDAIAEAVETVTAAAGGAAPILLGHSLGGTLAAVFAAVDPQRVAGLTLLNAPLCFGPGSSEFRDAVVRLVGPAPAGGELVPGSFLSHVSALACPSAFVWSRLTDVAMSLADPQSLHIHLRVERWALDEVALPGEFMGQVLDWLYREDRFCRGVLPVKGRMLGPSDLSTPTLAVVDAADEVAPRAAVEALLAAAPAASGILEYPGETGVALQHLALLIGRHARTTVWPRIVAWLDRTAGVAPH
jgi:polyhydroxyalkanoate synthase